MKKIIALTIIILSLGIFFFIRFEKGLKGDLPYCKDCNVILISLTNLRYDHMSVNGYFRPTTPNLDAFAKESLVFDEVFGHSSWTLPESISIFTSLYPFSHGVMDRYNGVALSKTTPTLIDIMENNGYLTAGFTGGFDYNPVFGLTNRYGEYQECTSGNDQISGYGETGCTIPKALNWIKNNLGKKFFVQVQGFDAHCPFSQKGGLTYDPNYKGTVDFSKCLWTFDRTNPIIKDGKKYYQVYSPETNGRASILLGEEDVKHLIALYDESITESDRRVGTFLNEIKKLGLEKNTIIIFTSEHGDMFGKDGRFMRGGPLSGTFYDDVLHVPLMIKDPKIRPKYYSELVQHIDILPTLLDLLGVKNNYSFEGKSLIPVILQNKEVNKYVFAGAEYDPGMDNPNYKDNTREEVVRSKDWKLIKETITSQIPLSTTLQLFDLKNDKEEFYNVANNQKNILSGLQLQLNEWSKRVREK